MSYFSNSLQPKSPIAKREKNESKVPRYFPVPKKEEIRRGSSSKNATANQGDFGPIGWVLGARSRNNSTAVELVISVEKRI